MSGTATPHRVGGPPASVRGPLRIGFLGSGFISELHLQALRSVRGAQVAAVFSPDPGHRQRLASRVEAAGLGPCHAANSVRDLLESEGVEAVWVMGPNHRRLEHMAAIHKAARTSGSQLAGVACEKPLARNLAEAQEMLHLASDAGLLHAYLENEIFAPALRRGREAIWERAVPGSGRPYLVRAVEEHSGPHRAWFWQGSRSGGGALLDMMCHSLEVGRFLLTDPGKERSSLVPRSATGSVATLKWSQPGYARQLREAMGEEVDYISAPAEDFAQGEVRFTDELGNQVVLQATSSWAYVGAGVQARFEVLGPEYVFESSNLASGTGIFLSRGVGGAGSEELVEKQNADQGLVPLIGDEAAASGFVAEDQHVVSAFRRGARPEETFDDGVAVLELLMALYRSAEEGRTLPLPDPGLLGYIPPVARSARHRELGPHAG